jgi:damage-control phosphatase, subfamily I
LKTYFECIPCIINQAIITLELCGSSRDLRKKVISSLLQELKNIDYNLSPSENTDIAYWLISKYTGINDPYLSMKKDHNIAALKLYPELEKMLNLASDRLYMAAKIAIAGNIIDMGISSNHNGQMDFKQILRNIQELPLAIDDFSKFMKNLTRTKNILYMADNAGEIVFDKIFINELAASGKNIIVSVKSGPIINDANIDDALQAGIDKIAKIVETGHNRIGNPPGYMSAGFAKIFKSSDLIICKGQGNFETLESIQAPAYFLLKAKCNSVAKELGVNYLDIVFAKSKNFMENKC